MGIAGGRRTGERESVHYAATIDGLINLASKDCLARKAASKAQRPSPQPANPTVVRTRPPQRLAVLDIQVDESGFQKATRVIVQADNIRVLGEHVRPANSHPIESVAKAALNAAEQLIRDSRFDLLEISLHDMEDGSTDVEVVALNRSGKLKQPVFARRKLKSGLPRVVAEAALTAAFSVVGN
jgi:hypothetical protein